MAHGFALLGDSVALSVIVNTGDDLELHGLSISPDLDTVMYTLGSLANDETGWGVRDETWSSAAQLERYGEPTWFRLGDRDLATHVARTARLRAGESLTQVTRELATSLGVTASILPMTDDPVRTKLLTKDGWLDFQDYFVRRGHRDEVSEIRYDGIASAAPTAEVIAAIDTADLIVIAPSNPYLSVAPILGLDGMLQRMSDAHAPTVAISPIVGGDALRGPAGRLMQSLGDTPSASGIAALYATRYPGLIDVLLIDEIDSDETEQVKARGIRPHATGIVMDDHEARRRLAREILAIAGLTASEEAA